MSYTQHLFNLPNNLLALFRNLETTRKKICKAEWSKIFNNDCQNYQKSMFGASVRTTHILKCCDNIPSL